MRLDSEAIIAGLLSAGVLTTADWLAFWDKLLVGGALAVITGFCYAAGKWGWAYVVARLAKRGGNAQNKP